MIADLHKRELSWIRDGRNPEEEFDRLYDAEPEVAGAEVETVSHDERLKYVLAGAAAALLIAGVACAAGLIFMIRRLRRA